MVGVMKDLKDSIQQVVKNNKLTILRYIHMKTSLISDVLSPADMFIEVQTSLVVNTFTLIFVQEYCGHYIKIKVVAGSMKFDWMRIIWIMLLLVKIIPMSFI